MPPLDLKEKRNKKKQMPSYNDGHNIMKIFYVSPNFLSLKNKILSILAK